MCDGNQFHKQHATWKKQTRKELFLKLQTEVEHTWAGTAMRVVGIASLRLTIGHIVIKFQLTVPMEMPTEQRQSGSFTLNSREWLST